MAQLIKLNVSKRTPVPGNGKIITPSQLYGFDVEDIIIPIRRNVANTASYFTARQMKGSISGGSDNNGRADYEVSDALIGISGQSSFLALLTVLERRGVDMSSEPQIFVRSRISENISPVLNINTGTYDYSKFYYNEDGDPEVVEYIVAEDVSTIVGTSSGGGGAPVTEIDYNLATGTDIDLTGYSGEMIINVSNGANPTGTLNTISNASNVTKITIRPISSLTLTVNDGNAATNPKLNAPTLVVYGLYHGFLELSARLNKFYQTNYIDQYNP